MIHSAYVLLTAVPVQVSGCAAEDVMHYLDEECTMF